MSTKRIVAVVILTNLVVLLVVGAFLWLSAGSARPVLAQAGQPGPAGPGDEDHDPNPGSYTVPTLPDSSYVTVAGYAFTPRTFRTQLDFVPGGGAFIITGTDPLVASLPLPHGATLTEFRFFYYDNSSANARAELKRTNFQGTIDELASLSTSGASPVFTSIAAALNASVNNAQYAYTVNVYLNPGDSNLRSYGIRVSYAIYGNFLPVIQKR